MTTYPSLKLRDCEEDRATRDVSDDERESIGLVLTDHLEQNAWRTDRLRPSVYSQTADELQAQQRLFRIESERWDGDYSSSPFPTGGIGTGQSADPLPLTRSKLISEGLKEYFEHYAHREQRTNQEKQLGFRRFLAIRQRRSRRVTALSSKIP